MSDANVKIENASERALRESPLLQVLLERRSISRKSLIAGVIGTLLFHLIGLFGLPGDVFQTERTKIENPYREYEVELAFPEEEPEQVYTQTNPDAPENEPDQTNNFAARSQQAAQEELPDEVDPENRPSSESEDDIDTNQFVTGDLSLPEFSPPPAPQSERQDEAESAQEMPLLTPLTPSQPLMKSIPVAGEEEEIDPEATGIAELKFDDLDEPPTSDEELLKGESEEGDQRDERAVAPQPMVQPQNAAVAADASQPSPRPRLRLPKVAPSPIRNHSPGVSRTGTIAVDAKFSEFGEYMERFIETVSVRWNALAQEAAAKENRSRVVLRFKLTKNGDVLEMETRFPQTTSKAIGIYMCRTAVEEGAPFGPWTPEMVEVFGDDEEITFSFHYY